MKCTRRAKTTVRAFIPGSASHNEG